MGALVKRQKYPVMAAVFFLIAGLGVMALAMWSVTWAVVVGLLLVIAIFVVLPLPVRRFERLRLRP